jgi:hypothetical protein
MQFGIFDPMERQFPILTSLWRKASMLRGTP